MRYLAFWRSHLKSSFVLQCHDIRMVSPLGPILHPHIYMNSPLVGRSKLFNCIVTQRTLLSEVFNKSKATAPGRFKEPFGCDLQPLTVLQVWSFASPISVKSEHHKTGLLVVAGYPRYKTLFC